MASKTSLALVAVLSLGVPLSLARAQTGTSAFPGVDPAAIEDLVLANRILANEKVLDASAMSASAIPATQIVI